MLDARYWMLDEKKKADRLNPASRIQYQRCVQRIAYYITAHGYGHGVRSCDIIRGIHRTRPDATVWIVTDLPHDFLRSRLEGDAGVPAREKMAGKSARPTHFHNGAFDSGMFQLDSIRVDLPRSLAAAEKIQSQREALIEKERAFLRREKIEVVVADIPAIPMEAAKAEGLRAVAVGNFGWDWIYADFIARDARWRAVSESFSRGYAQADALLKLPFAEPMAAFRKQISLPLVASPGRARREEIAKHYGASAAKTWVLLSFTSLDWDEATLARVSRMTDFEFFTVMPLAWNNCPNIRAVDRHLVPFADVIASCDMVVSKPGYGILSDCCVNDKPLVYAEREDFCEYPVLEAAIKRHMRGVHIPAAKLYAGEMETYLHAALRVPAPREPIASGGAEIAAGLVAAHT